MNDMSELVFETDLDYLFVADSFDTMKFDTDDIYNTEINKSSNTMLEFADNNSIILYTALTKESLLLLHEGKYRNLIHAHETPNFIHDKQLNYIVKIKYNTKYMFDILDSNNNIIDTIVKRNNIKKSELDDNKIINYILKSGYSGIRYIKHDNKKKFTNTEIFYNNLSIGYLLNPKCIEIIKDSNKEKHP